MSEAELAHVLERVNGPHQFSAANNILVTHMERDHARGELTVGENSVNPYGNVHGGALTTLADVVGGCCACSRGGRCVTLSCTMEFLRPAAGPKIYCTATPKKMGRKVSVIQLELTNEAGDVVATGTYSYFMGEA